MIDHTGSWSDSDNYSPFSSTSDSRSGRIRSRSVGHIYKPHEFSYENQYAHTMPCEHMYNNYSPNIPEHKILYQMYPSPNKVAFSQAPTGQEFGSNSLPSSRISNSGEHFYVQRELKKKVPRSRRKSINLPIVQNYKSLDDLKNSNNQLAHNVNCSNSDTKSPQALKAFYEREMSLLRRTIDDLKNDKLNLKKQVSSCKMEMIKVKAEATNEMESISTEVEKLKNNLKNRHKDVVNQWSDTLEKLSGRIDELGISSTNINNAIAAMEQKLNILEAETTKEMDVLQKRYNEEVRKCRSESENIVYMNEKFKSEKILEESKTESLKMEFQSIIKSKEAEIEKLKKSIQEQCLDMQHDIEEMQKEILVKNNKIPVEVIIDSNMNKLQKYISKLEKEKGKYVRNYEKKIALLVKEIELQEKSKVIQLKMHRTQVLLEVSTKHQMETSKVAAELEQRYKRLLDEQRSEAEFRHTHDLKIIDELRKNIIDLTNI